MPQPALHKLDSLTTLRFFAAAMIVIHHSAGLFGLPPNPGGRFQLDQAVSFFFILSGFILTYVYPSLTTWADRRRFWLARFARVWPAHFAAFILLWLILQHGYNFPTGNASRSLAVLNLALVHAWVPVRNVFFSFNSPSWTLSTEMAFYLLFPFLIWNWRKTWWIKLLGAFALAAAAIAFCRWANLTADNPSTPWSISNTGMLYIHPLPRLFEFTIGMTAALLFQRTADKINLHILPATFLECLGIALVLLNMYYANNIITTVLHLLPPGTPADEWLIHGPVCCLSFAALIYVMALQRGWISKLLSVPLGIVLGEISFTVYLLHFILINFYIHHRAVFSAWPGGITYCLFFVIVLLLAWIVWAGVERPLRTRILSLWPNRDPQALARQLARAYATPPESSRWAYISQPGYPSVVVGILILGLLLTPVGMAFYSLDYPAASSSDIAAIVAATPPEIRNARFGDQMELFGAVIKQTSYGIELKLACIATANSSRHLALGIHIIDQKGNILAQPDFFENAIHFMRQKPWIDTIEIPTEKMTKANAIAIVIFEQGGAVQPVDRGPRDWDNHRLLLSLP